VPFFADVFEGWTDDDMKLLIERLDKMKVWLDTKGREPL